MTELSKAISALRKKRLALGMSQCSVAAMLGTTQTRISRIESGARDVSLKELLAIMTCLQMTFNDLFEAQAEVEQLRDELERRDQSIHRLFNDLLQLRQENQRLHSLLGIKELEEAQAPYRRKPFLPRQ